MKNLLKITLAFVVMLSTVFTVPRVHENYLFSKNKSIVKVYFPEKGSGTGFVIKRGKYKYILTNRHVCRINGGKDMLIADNKGKSYVSKVLVFSKHYDLCIMSAPQKLKALSFANNSRYLEDSYVLGHPLGLPISLEKGKMQERSVIELAISCDLLHDKKIKLPTIYQIIYGKSVICLKSFDAIRTNAVIHPGNSGSPILDIFGRVQAVAFAGSSRAQNVGYVIPLDIVKKFLDSVKFKK